jgi:Putative zinc-finger
MSCDAFEELIALDAGDDLAPAEAARVRAHLDACASCRELARNVAESRAALKALSEDAPDEDALAPWRRNLMARIEAAPRRPALGWGWAWAAAVAMALLALLVLRTIPRHAPPPPAVLAHVTPPAIPPALLARVALPAIPPAPPSIEPRPARPAHPGARHRRAPTPAPEPLLVKLETSDPNVVIYWILEGKGN